MFHQNLFLYLLRKSYGFFPWTHLHYLQHVLIYVYWTIPSTMKSSYGEWTFTWVLEFGLQIFCKYLIMDISLSFSFFPMESLADFGIVSYRFLSTWYKHEPPWNRKPKLRNRFHNTSLWPCLWDIIWINHWWRGRLPWAMLPLGR